MIHIRRATPEDADALSRLFVAVRTLCFGFLDIDYPTIFLRGLFARRMQEGQEWWLAEVDGRLAGYAAREETELDALYVLPEFHGKGVGLALLDEAKKASDGELWLWVFQKNTQARRFYEKNGFVLDHQTDGQGNMEKEPDARYVWRREN